MRVLDFNDRWGSFHFLLISNIYWLQRVLKGTYKERKMLAIFNKELANPPQELYSPASLCLTRKPKLPEEILKDSVSSNLSNAFLRSFGEVALLAYISQGNSYPGFQSLNKQYGLSKCTNEAMLIIEAYRTLHDCGPYLAHKDLQDLDGRFGFVVYDTKAGPVFAALGANEGVGLFWSIAGDGLVVISDNLVVIKKKLC